MIGWILGGEGGSALTSFSFTFIVSKGTTALTFLTVYNFTGAGSISTDSLFDPVSRCVSKEFILSFYSNESVLYLPSSAFLSSSFSEISATFGVWEFLRIYSILSIKACLFIDSCRLMAMAFIFSKWIEADPKFFYDLWLLSTDWRCERFFWEAACFSLLKNWMLYRLPISRWVSQKMR